MDEINFSDGKFVYNEKESTIPTIEGNFKLKNYPNFSNFKFVFYNLFKFKDFKYYI
ncbi:MAG: hypothetical protein ACTSRZ_11195 [Promethearchaeota archaeon]